ncbi:hypothetical protein K7432_014787 [Basidiobolus ranarum]
MSSQVSSTTDENIDHSNDEYTSPEEGSISNNLEDSPQGSNKRALSDSEETTEDPTEDEKEEEEVEDNCPICLSGFQQKTFVEPCLHTYCFQCIELWASAHRQCPLCKVEFFSVIYNVAYETYRRFTFPPLALKHGPQSTQAPHSSFRPQPYRRRRPIPQYGPIEVDEEQRIEAGYRKRRLVYKYKLRAVHIGSNAHSGFQPASLQSQSNTARVVAWIRRDLQVLLNDEDVELVKEHILAILKK